MREKFPLNIKQTAELYGVSADTLRYYESIGLISPERGENSYRVYCEEEFARLNIVMSMLEMNFTLSDIRDYLSSRSLEKSIGLFNKEVDRIEQTVSKLLLRRRKIEQCLRSTMDAIIASKDEHPRLRHREKRHCIEISDDVDIRAEPLPFQAVKRSHELGVNIDSLHSIPCFVMDYTRIRDDDCFVPERALLSIEEGEYREALSFPEGDYVCRTVRGPAQLDPGAFSEMLSFMGEQHLSPRGKLLEFWHVNEYISDNEEEYLHTLEIMVGPEEG